MIHRTLWYTTKFKGRDIQGRIPAEEEWIRWGRKEGIAVKKTLSCTYTHTQATIRSWKAHFTVLSGTQLHFYKDKKDSQTVKGESSNIVLYEYGSEAHQVHHDLLFGLREVVSYSGKGKIPPPHPTQISPLDSCLVITIDIIFNQSSIVLFCIKHI